MQLKISGYSMRHGDIYSLELSHEELRSVREVVEWAGRYHDLLDDPEEYEDVRNAIEELTFVL